MPPEEDEQQQAHPKPKSSKMKIIIPVVLVLVLAGGGAFAYFKFFMPHGPQQASEAAKKPDVIIIHEMDTFIVNLSDSGGKRFLKVAMKAKMSSQAGEEEFKARNFELRDIILTILTSKETEEIVRPEDKASLKQQIIAALNRSLHKGQVEDLYFTDFLIQ